MKVSWMRNFAGGPSVAGSRAMSARARSDDVYAVESNTRNNLADAGVLFTFVDPDVKNYSSRFRRGVAPQQPTKPLFI